MLGVEILFWLIRLVGNGLVTIDTLSGDVGLNARVLSHAWVKVNSGVFSGVMLEILVLFPMTVFCLVSFCSKESEFVFFLFLLLYLFSLIC